MAQRPEGPPSQPINRASPPSQRGLVTRAASGERASVLPCPLVPSNPGSNPSGGGGAVAAGRAGPPPLPGSPSPLSGAAPAPPGPPSSLRRGAAPIRPDLRALRLAGVAGSPPLRPSLRGSTPSPQRGSAPPASAAPPLGPASSLHFLAPPLPPLLFLLPHRRPPARNQAYDSRHQACCLLLIDSESAAIP